MAEEGRGCLGRKPSSARRPAEGPWRPDLMQWRKIIRCARCAGELSNADESNARCGKCGAELHACMQCAFFDPARPAAVPAADCCEDCREGCSQRLHALEASNDRGARTKAAAPPGPVGRPSTTSSSSAAWHASSGTSPTSHVRQHLIGLPTAFSPAPQLGPRVAPTRPPAVCRMAAESSRS